MTHFSSVAVWVKSDSFFQAAVGSAFCDALLLDTMVARTLTAWEYLNFGLPEARSGSTISSTT